jgi:predicted RNase H-like HicB family nuclease
MHNLAFTVNIFREGETFVAHAPELDVSSCGDTPEAAGQNIRDAVLGFLETADEQGTLSQVLEESGYRKEGESWRAPELISTGRMAVGLG